MAVILREDFVEAVNFGNSDYLLLDAFMKDLLKKEIGEEFLEFLFHYPETESPLSCVCGGSRRQHAGGKDECLLSHHGCKCKKFKPKKLEICTCGHEKANHRDDGQCTIMTRTGRNQCRCKKYTPEKPCGFCGDGLKQHSNDVDGCVTKSTTPAKLLKRARTVTFDTSWGKVVFKTKIPKKRGK